MFFNNVTIPSTYMLVDSPRKLAWLRERLLASPEFGFDIENSHPTLKNKEKVRAYTRTTTIYISGISFAWGRTGVQDPWEPGNAAYIPLTKADDSPYWGERQDAVVQVLKSILETDIPKVAHNGKFDVSELAKRLGIYTRGLWFDTMLAHALLDEEKLGSSHALKSDFDKQGRIFKMGVSDYYLNTEASCFKEDLGSALTHYDPHYRRYSKVPLDIMYPYACADSDLTFALRHVFYPMLQKEETLWVFQNVVMPLQHSIMMMEMHGCPLNITRAKSVEKEQKELMVKYEAEVHALAGKIFNVGSGEQLGNFLFDELDLQPRQRNKRGWVVDVEALDKLDHPIIEPIKHYRRAQKIQSTYASSALDLVQEITNDGHVGWVHPSIWLDGVTGRLKCQDPNLTNLPRPENGGDIVKSMWQGGDDYVFLFKDFSQIELRVIAHVSGEPTWIDGFNAGYDMHAAMAKTIFHLDCPVDQVKDLYKSERSYAKTINFGIAYGESVYALAEKLELTYEEANKLVNEDYFGAAPTLKAWIDYTHQFSEDEGYVYNMFKRRRHLPNAQIIVPDSAPWPKYNDRPACYRDCVKPMHIGFAQGECDLYSMPEDHLKGLIQTYKRTHHFKCKECPYIRSCFINSEVKYLDGTKKRALRQSVNSIIQGSAADMSSMALVWITEELRRQNVRSRPCLYIHDEIGCYTHKDDVEKAERIMEDCMVRRLKEFTNFSVPIVTDTEIVQCWGDKK